MKKRNMLMKIVDAIAVRAIALEVYVAPLLRRILLGMTNMLGYEIRIITTRAEHNHEQTEDELKMTADDILNDRIITDIEYKNYTRQKYLGSYLIF
jgi:hypothetical protein